MTSRSFRRSHLCGILLAVFFTLSSHALIAVEPFLFAGQQITPGESRSFMIGTAPLDIPVSVFHGISEGPVLVLTAGVHGDEFPSILALQRLRQSLDASKLQGTLVLLHVANLSSFHARQGALSPLDGKNLNRVFPGSADGSPTERLAAFMTEEVIGVADYLVDMHSGSWTQHLLPHVYAPFVDDPALDEETLAFTRALGMTHIVLYGERPRDPDNAISYPNAAMTRGKPAPTVEIGHLGQRDEKAVDGMLQVSLNAMRYLGMLPGESASGEGVDEEPAVLYERLIEVASTDTGLFHPAVSIGDEVSTGDLLGHVTNYFGDHLSELRAPQSGIVMMIANAPPVTAAQTPVTLGIRLATQE